MKDIILYAAQVSLFLSIFFIIYRLFLRPATFFKFNRLYLLTGLFSSFVLPLVHFSYDVVIPASLSVEIVEETINPPTLTGGFFDNWGMWHILMVVYLSGVFILSFRYIVGCIQLARLIRSGKMVKNEKYIIVDNEKVASPFTVFRYILLNTMKLLPKEQELILKHEITHVTQKHWFDLVFSQGALILQWFNPLVWFYISSMKENHEFLADQAVIKAGYSPFLYQAVLINQRFQGPVFSFANSFNYSNHLKRLTMMKKMKSSPWKRLSVLIIIPVLGFFFWVSATPNYILTGNDDSPAPVSDSLVVVGYGSMGNVISVAENIAKDIAGKRVSKVENNGKISLRTSALQDGKQPLYILDGKEVSSIENIAPADIDNISVWKDSSAIRVYGEKGKNGVVIIESKGKKDKSGNLVLTYMGRVMKKDTKNGIPMVSVQIKGSDTGTLTDDDGNYTIKAPENSTLIFSNKGYKTEETKALRKMTHIFLEEE